MIKLGKRTVALLLGSLCSCAASEVSVGPRLRSLGIHFSDTRIVAVQRDKEIPENLILISKEVAGMPSNGTTSVLRDKLIGALAVSPDVSHGYVLRVHGALLATAFQAFQEAGAYGNGPGWTALAEYLVTTTPAITGVTFDDEGGAFSAYSEDGAALQELRTRLIETVSEKNKLYDAIRAVRARGFGRGDL